MKLISRIHTALLYPMARVIVEGQSAVQRVRSIGKKANVRHEAPYGGERILLLALYEKGVLRPDILRLLAEAKAQGLYVLAVNTLRLKDPGALTGLIDCYIERPNFGRDFGSYKTGFLHVYARGWEKTCPRLLMLNDSVFYSSRGLSKFLTDLATSPVEILGATENFEIEYHLGSFCIAMAGSVLRDARVRRYWAGYRVTDVRPKVIRRGEMKLSRTLKRAVSSPDQFGALFSSARFVGSLRSTPSLVEAMFRDARNSNLVDWPRFEVERIAQIIRGRFVVPRFEREEKLELQLASTVGELHEEHLIANSADTLRYLTRHVKDSSERGEEVLHEAISAVAAEVFMSGSQIHQNATVLLGLGLPIVKLDGVYRGMFNAIDVLRLQAKLPEDEARALADLLLERPFGGRTLVGWKRSAFYRGLI